VVANWMRTFSDRKQRLAELRAEAAKAKGRDTAPSGPKRAHRKTGKPMTERCAKCGEDFTSTDPLESFCPKCWKALEHEVEAKLRKTISSDPDDDRR